MIEGRRLTEKTLGLGDCCEKLCGFDENALKSCVSFCVFQNSQQFASQTLFVELHPIG